MASKRKSERKNELPDSALKLRVEELEKELAQTRESLAAVQVEFDAYRRSLHALVLKQFSEADLRRFADEEDEAQCKPLHQFIGELEDIVELGKRA